MATPIPLEVPLSDSRRDGGIEVQLLYAAYQRRPLNLKATVIGVPIMIALMWTSFPGVILLTWAGAILATQIAGHIECRAFARARPDPEGLTLWRRIFAARALAAGLAWSIGPTWIMGQFGGVASILLICILMCVCAIGITSICEQPVGMFGFMGGALLPPACAAMWSGGDVENLEAVLLLACLAVFVAVGRNSNRNLRSMLENQSRMQSMLEAEKATKDRLALFHSIFEASSRAMVVTDGAGRGLYQNRAHEMALGYSDSEIIGQPFVKAFPIETATAMATEIRDTLLLGKHWIGRLAFLRKDGSAFTSASHIGAIRDDNGVIRYTFNIFTDITSELAWREELKQAKEIAERANRAKSDFLSSMSHELRTPMNAILGFAQMLEYDTDLNADQHDSVHEIIKGGRHLLNLINEVLDLAKIESGHINLSLEPVTVSEIVEDCWQLILPMAQARHIEMLRNVPSALAVRADRMRLKQVVLNLLSNAVKYNREGGSIRVSAALREQGFVRVQVADTGAGIAPERLGDLFTAFNRLGAEMSGVEGTGIGLSITRKLMELMDGRIGVESKLDSGTTFWIELPVETTIESGFATLSTDGKADVRASSRQYQVLCIDDNPVNIKLFAQMLGKRSDIHLITAHAPGLGIELARAHRPDLVLLDINMPGMDGYEVLEVFKADHDLCGIPVLAVTANAMPRDILRGRLAGFADYLTKPIDVNAFLQTLDRCLTGVPENLP